MHQENERPPSTRGSMIKILKETECPPPSPSTTYTYAHVMIGFLELTRSLRGQHFYSVEETMRATKKFPKSFLSLSE